MLGTIDGLQYSPLMRHVKSQLVVLLFEVSQAFWLGAWQIRAHGVGEAAKFGQQRMVFGNVFQATVQFTLLRSMAQGAQIIDTGFGNAAHHPFTRLPQQSWVELREILVPNFLFAWHSQHQGQ